MPTPPLLPFSGVLAPLLVVLAALAGAGCSLESKFYRPASIDFANPLDVTDLHIDAPGGDHIHAWFVPPPQQTFPAPLLVFCHGSATTINQMIDTLRPIAARADAGLLLFSYRGYGRSSPREKVTRSVTIEDTHCVVDAAMNLPGVDPARIVLFGYSLGAVPALRVGADDERIAAVIAGGTYSRAESALDDLDKGWIAPLIGGYADPADSARRLGQRPLLIFHGELDNDARVYHAYTIAAAAARAGVPTTLHIVPDAGHFNILDDQPQLVEALASFIRAAPAVKEAS